MRQVPRGVKRLRLIDTESSTAAPSKARDAAAGEPPNEGVGEDLAAQPGPAEESGGGPESPADDSDGNGQGQLVPERDESMDELPAVERADHELPEIRDRLASLEISVANVAGSVRDAVADTKRTTTDHRPSPRRSTRSLTRRLGPDTQSPIGLRDAVRELRDTIRDEVDQVFKSMSSDLGNIQATFEDRLRSIDDDLRERIEALEHRVVDSVAREIDRRFETLIRLIEAGMPQVGTPDAHGRPAGAPEGRPVATGSGRSGGYGHRRKPENRHVALLTREL